MALSGTVYGSVSANSNHYTYYFTWSATQSIEKNQSTITVKHYWGKIGGNTFNSVYARDYGITIAGNTSSGSKVMDFDPWPQDPIISSHSYTVDHNPDGTKSITISTWANGRASSFGPSASTNDADDCKASATITLDTIPRAASLTAAPNFNDEGNPVITYSNPAGSVVSALDVAIYNSDGSASYAAYRAATKTGTSYTFNLTDAERTKLRQATPNSNTLDVRFYIRTKIGDSTFHNYLDKTMTIVNGNPTLNPTVQDSNTTTVALTGDANKLVKYYSDAAYTIGAAAVKASTLKSQKVTHSGISKTTATGTYNDVENASFTFEAKDSRGNVTTKTVTKTLINYIKLTCNHKESISAEGVATVNVSGNYFNGSFGKTANTLTVQYRYKVNDGTSTYSEWKAVTASISENTYEATFEIPGLNYQSPYMFQCRVIDKLVTVEGEEKAVKALPVFDWGENDFHIHGDLSVEGAVNFTAMGDYVVESGDTGSYGYKKWNSGLMEAWRTATSAVSVTSSSTSGSLYFTSQVTLKTNGAASQFVSLDNVQISVNKEGAVGLWQPVIARTNVADGAASADVLFINSVKDASVSIVPYVYFIGRWK